MRKLLYCQCAAQDPTHWAFHNWRRYFLDAGWMVIDFDYEIERLRLGTDGMAEILMKLIRHERPDVIWHSLYQDEFPPDLLTMMRDYAPILGFASDDQWRLEHSLLSAPHYTAILTTEQDALPHYRAVGARPVLCRWAVHPPSYLSLPEDRPTHRTIPVVFVGQALPYRLDIAHQLWQRDVPLSCFGKGWLEACPHTAGVYPALSWKQMLAVYAHSQIVVGMCYGSGDGRPQIKARHVEIPAIRRLHLVNVDTALFEYFPEPLCVMWKTIDDLVALIQTYRTHQQERIHMAQQQYAHCLAEHTWANRLEIILQGVA